MGEEKKEDLTDSVIKTHNYVYQCIEAIDFVDPDVQNVKALKIESDNYLKTSLDRRNVRFGLNEEYSDAYKNLGKKYLKKSFKFNIVGISFALGFLIYTVASAIFGKITNGEFKAIPFTGFPKEMLFVGIIMFGIAFCFTILGIIFDSKKSLKLAAWSNAEEKLNESKQIVQQLFLLNTVEALLLDKAMFKGLYQKIYEVQEWLRENDPKGFKSLEKAFEKTDTNLLEYVKHFQENGSENTEK